MNRRFEPFDRWGTAVSACLLVLMPLHSAQGDGEELKLWYGAPAKRWEQEALPLGNGNLGCMVFGGVNEERIQFNEDSLWVGDEGDTGMYQAFGDVFIRLGDSALSGPPTNPSGHNSREDQGVGKTNDGSSDTKWCTEHGGRTVVWQVDGVEGASSYSLMSAGDVPSRDPRKWKLFGTKDGKEWTLLDERELEKPFEKRGIAKHFEFENKEGFQSFKFEFEPTDKSHFQVAEITLHPGDGIAKGGVESYRRELDIEDSVHRVSYVQDGIRFEREYFASRPANALVFRLSADKPGAHSGTITLTDAHDAEVRVEGDTLISSGSLEGYLPMKRRKKDYEISLSYEAQLRVLHEGGTLSEKDGALSFEDCDSLTILLVAGTDYLNQRDKGWKGEHPHDRLTSQLAAASKDGLEVLRKEHVADYHGLFNRLSLELGDSPKEIRDLPTDERLISYRGRKVDVSSKINMGEKAGGAEGGTPDPDLEELLFQYARYLMISCSREGALPANLQGLWNQTNTPPWRSDYHSDVNIQMNYWFVDAANLSSCFLPLAEWVHSIREVRKEETKAEFKTRGWAMHAENGIFGGSTYKWSKGDSSWIAQNLWDHYAFTQDKEYLRTRAYPVMKELCHFWEDYLKELPDGTLVAPDGWSPEHGPIEDGVSFDQQLAWDLFTNFIEASEVLDEDEELRGKVRSMRERLLKPQIGKWGQLQEWMVDRDDPNNDHRHVSQLVGLHPGRQISPLKTPDLAKAAKVSLEARGDGGTGWSKAWKISFWARLLDGDRAHKLLRELIHANIYDNLFDTHPPFQIDGNFGYAAGVCEMLVQSHLGEIHLLPALPEIWSSGEVKGMLARGGFELDMKWENESVTEYELRRLPGLAPTEVAVRVNGEVVTKKVR